MMCCRSPRASFLGGHLRRHSGHHSSATCPLGSNAPVCSDSLERHTVTRGWPGPGKCTAVHKHCGLLQDRHARYFPLALWAHVDITVVLCTALLHESHATSVYAVEFAGPAIGTKDNADLISPAFTNPNGAWLGAPQSALVGEYDGQKAILLLNLDRCSVLRY